MLYPLASDALFSANYVDNYIESVDAVPEDIQQLITSIRNIDVQFRNLLRDVDHYYDLVRALPTSEANPEVRKTKRQRALQRMHQALIRAQEMGDDKMRLVNHMQEVIDYKSRHLDSTRDNLDMREEQQQFNLQQMQQQGNVVITAAKNMQTQSPMLIDEVLGEACATAANADMLIGKDIAYAGYTVSAGNANNNMEVSGQMASNTLNIMSGDVGRGNNKRTRRRNETVNDFESTSAHDGGSNMLSSVGMIERPTTSRTMSASSLKKGIAQNSGNMVAGVTGSSTSTNISAGNSSAAGSSGSAGKKKKRKAGGRQTSTQTQMQTNAREDTPPVEAIDPDEPTYCVCNQISFGEMILCDNDLCPIEWFHFSCVSLVLKPKGKWYCPNCRGDRPNIMKPKAQFLKELERYNKEKEEKT